MDHVAAARIRQKRQELSMTQEALAAAIGTSQKQVSRYENGDNDPTGDVLRHIAEALDVSVDWLLGLEDTDPVPIEAPTLVEREKKVIRLWRQGNITEAIKVMVGG